MLRRKKISIIIFLILLLLGGAVLCITRWKAWFANAPEPVYQVGPAPDNIVLTLGEDASSQRVISWRADTVLRHSALLLSRPDASVDTFPATDTVIASRSGKAAFYYVRLDSLSEGLYTYRLLSGRYLSAPRAFSIAPSDSLHVLLFGDIQETDTLSPFSSFCSSLARRSLLTTHYSLTSSSLSTSLNSKLSTLHSHDCPDVMCYVGDIVERPTDDYWQVFFASSHGLTASVPQLAVPGNHEYLKGVHKTLGSRWKSVFVNPLNGPRRFLGTTYFVDYPTVRFIMIDTDGLQYMSGYLMTQCWLERVLSEAGDRWTVVVMHHPVHSAGMFRDNPLVHLFFHRTLRHADLVFAGHDHNYARRCELRDSVFTTPVGIVTSSASKCYIPKCSPDDQRIGSCRAFYEDLLITSDSISVLTRFLDNDSVYDALTLSRDKSLLTANRSLLTVADPPLTDSSESNYSLLTTHHSLVSVSVSVADSLPDEIIELPERFRGQNSVAVRRFYNRRSHRLAHE